MSEPELWASLIFGAFVAVFFSWSFWRSKYFPRAKGSCLEGHHHCWHEDGLESEVTKYHGDGDVERNYNKQIMTCCWCKQKIVLPHSEFWDEPSGCFIATACYGSSLAPELDVLRGFRDSFMVQNGFGRFLVRFYYTVSPPIADFIRCKDFLRCYVRVILDPIVKKLRGDEV